MVGEISSGRGRPSLDSSGTPTDSVYDTVSFTFGAPSEWARFAPRRGTVGPIGCVRGSKVGMGDLDPHGRRLGLGIAHQVVALAGGHTRGCTLRHAVDEVHRVLPGTPCPTTGPTESIRWHPSSWS